ncbi:response regulator [Roseococcus sp. SDR]|uniref:hybrid sensor histidine kinase/response regulator n=1 Tax=Roseococcus sp. SDR TaxID=2835532 RepID=UPI001BCB2CCF|nr:hybrid sensor histidine kinase/response regulator [Roseococcus sp. SDR]MBS7789731.1 response regulator [Roseococcus sp. SDR]MBV1845045.1 response regulator [Roseococcus sp. SDR]
MARGGPRMTVQGYLRLLFALSVLLPAAVFVANGIESHRRVWNDAERHVDGTIAVMHEHAQKVFETQELVLDLVNDMVRETAAAEISSPAMNRRLATLAERLAQTVSIWITDADGTVAAGSIAWPPGLNVTGFEYFEAQRDADRPKFVSARYIGRSTGQPSFALSRRRLSADGSFAGIIHVAISPRYFEQYFELVDRERAGAASIFRSDGTMLARFPVAPLPNRLSPSSPTLLAIAEEPAGGRFQGVSSLDGVRRVYAYRRIGDFDVYVGYGANMPMHLAAWRLRMLQQGLATLVVILLLCGITWLISRSLADRQAALNRLREESELREAMQQRLQEARSLEALGRMARGIAHDFNNLLTVVMGNLETLSRERHDAASLRALAAARKATEAGAHLAASLLTYARTQVLQIETIRVEPFLRNLAELLQQIATPARHLRFDIAPGLPDCEADVAQLTACLGNLVANARDATEPGGSLLLSAALTELSATELVENPAARPGPFIVISLRDNGTGMTREVAARVFEPFFTTKAEGEGSGLGLSQVFGLMRQLRGHVTIDTAPGAGTTVNLFLPVLAALARIEAAPASERSRTGRVDDAAPTGRPARILVVDDEAEIRHLVEHFLTRAGFSVVVASGGDEALRIFNEDRDFDLVLSDVMMPDNVDGLSLARVLRSMDPSLRILLMSGYAPGLERLDDLKISVVAKPFTRRSLLDAVETSLNQDRA